MSESAAAAIRSAATRGKVTNTRVGPRTLLLVSGLDNEDGVAIELLLPPGYSARPAAGADVLLLQVLGSRDHLVAVGGDMAGADAINDLAPGEFGFRFGARQVVFRTDHLELTSDRVAFRANTAGTGTVVFNVPLPGGPGAANDLYVDGSHNVKSSP